MTIIYQTRKPNGRFLCWRIIDNRREYLSEDVALRIINAGNCRIVRV